MTPIPRPYQLEGVSRIEELRGRALLADEMGLGKTAQAILFLSRHPNLRPAVVVVPASLVINWIGEWGLWNPDEKVAALRGVRPDLNNLRGSRVAVVSYSSLTNWVPILRTKRIQVVVLDEAHYIMNNNTIRKQQVFQLCRGVPYLLALTGTPIVAKPIQIFNTLKLLKPDTYHSKASFGMQWCKPEHNHFSGRLEWGVCRDPSGLNRELTRTVMIRRLKADVASELPAKQRVVIPLQLSNPKLLLQMKKAGRPFMDCYLEAMSQKIPLLVDWLRELGPDRPPLIFYHHNQVRDQLLTLLKWKRGCVMCGEVPMLERERIKANFQRGDLPGLLLQIVVGGEGHNLTKSSDVVFAEIPSTPKEAVQAEDRVHRLGQHRPVFIWYPVAASSPEVNRFRSLRSRASGVGGILDGMVDSALHQLGALTR